MGYMTSECRLFAHIIRQGIHSSCHSVGSSEGWANAPCWSPALAGPEPACEACAPDRDKYDKKTSEANWLSQNGWAARLIAAMIVTATKKRRKYGWKSQWNKKTWTFRLSFGGEKTFWSKVKMSKYNNNKQKRLDLLPKCYCWFGLN